MKIVLSWLLDHINVTKQEIDVQSLVKHFNDSTAEVDGFEIISTDLSSLYAVRITEVQHDAIQVESPEHNKRVTLPKRKEAQEGIWYLMKKEGDLFRWATLIDIGSSKDGLIAGLYMTDEQAHGSWRTTVEQEDVIIKVDNKEITNRPDLWGHRGCAREVAALLKKELIAEEHLLADIPVKHAEKKESGAEMDIAIESDACRRFAGLTLAQAEYRASLPWMAFRLARVDSRPIDAFVDISNYVMFDLGQPMHAFDKEKLSSRTLSARNAKKGETVVLIDGQEVTLNPADCVIADGDTPVSVAGVMGGRDTAVSRTTRSLFLESANFNPTTIRMTAARLKTRTESSARFEKSLDPNQTVQGILRYIKLLEDAGISYRSEEYLMSVGPLMKEKVIEVSHELIVQKIGMSLSSKTIIDILKRLAFGVEQEGETYTVTVPTFRATKDVTIPEDVVDEVARYVGFRSITPTLPMRKMAAYDTSAIERKRRLKHILAYGCSMHEVHTYAFYDEEFIKQLSFDPGDALRIANPLSEHWQRLITSLVPNLLKCVVTNHTEQDTLRFFEMNRVWFIQEHPVEEQEVAGIWYDHKKPIDFYDGKVLVEKVFAALNITIDWVKPTKRLAPWYNENQSAELWFGDRIIGRAGNASKEFLSRVLEGDAFILELDANFLLHVVPEKATFVPLAKYPTTEQDISMLVPLSVTVAGLESVIKQADARITEVELIDRFEKDEWLDQKSLTFRYTAADPEGTLTKEAIDEIMHHVSQAVTNLGAHVR